MLRPRRRSCFSKFVRASCRASARVSVCDHSLKPLLAVGRGRGWRRAVDPRVMSALACGQHMTPAPLDAPRLHVNITSSLIRDPPRASRHPANIRQHDNVSTSQHPFAQRPEALNARASQAQSECNQNVETAPHARHSRTSPAAPRAMLCIHVTIVGTRRQEATWKMEDRLL